MRIAIVTTSWPDGAHDAAGHFVRTEAARLERDGHVVDVIAPRAGGAFGWPGVAARVRQRPWRAVEAAAWVMRARGRVARARADVVIAHWAVPSAWPIAIANRRARVEVVSHGGDVRAIASVPRPLRDRLVRAVAMRASEWRFVSDALMLELLRSIGAGTRACVERIAAVRAAEIEMPDVRGAIARKRNELGRARVAVAVGRLVPGKRVERAIDHVAASRDLDAIVVVGDGPERAKLQARARAAGVDARFVGRVPRDEALAWIGAADVLIHSSDHEGLSTVVREAEALGTPVTWATAARTCR